MTISLLGSGFCFEVNDLRPDGILVRFVVGFRPVINPLHADNISARLRSVLGDDFSSPPVRRQRRPFSYL